MKFSSFEVWLLDRLNSSALAVSEVPTLRHEVVDHYMELAAIGVERLAISTGFTGLAGAELTKVL